MLRFTYTSLAEKPLTCRDCELYKSCYRTKGNYDNRITCNLFEVKRIHNPKVTDIGWDLHQILRQISVSMMGAGSLKNKHIREWITPKSLIGIPDDEPSFLDCHMYINVMKAFYGYIKDNEDDFKRSIKGIESMLRTVIVVRDDKVISSSTDKELNKILRKVVAGTEYKFTTDEPVFGFN